MLYNKWWKNAGKCSGDEKKQAEKEAHSLGVANVGGTFVILVGGLALAGVVSLIEFVTYNTKSNHRDHDHHQVLHAPLRAGFPANARHVESV